MLIVSENNACSYLVEIIHLFLRRGLNARRKRSTFPFKWLVLVYHCRKFPRVNLPQSLYAFSARYQRDTNNLQLPRNDKWTKLIASWHPFITSHPETHKTVSRSATLDKKFIVASWTNQRFILIPRKASFAGNQCSYLVPSNLGFHTRTLGLKEEVKSNFITRNRNLFAEASNDVISVTWSIEARIFMPQADKYVYIYICLDLWKRCYRHISHWFRFSLMPPQRHAKEQKQ